MGEKESASLIMYKQLMASFIHSLSSFLAAYLFVYLISGISVLYIAYDLDVPAKLFINSIELGLDKLSKPLTDDIVISIFMTKPVSNFIMGVVALFLFMFIKQKTYWLQLFLIWVFLHGFNLTFGLVSEDLILKTGLSNVAAVMEIRQVMLILTIGISLFFLVKAGTLVGKLFYAHIYQPSDSKKDWLSGFGCHFLFPWAAGSIIILSFSFQHNSLKDILLRLFILISLLPIIFIKKPLSKTFLATKNLQLFTAIIYLVIILGLMFVFATLLKDGFRIG